MKDILLIFLLGHILGDFIFQTDMIAKEKQKSLRGVSIHSLEYLVVFCLTSLVVYSFKILCAALIISDKCIIIH